MLRTRTRGKSPTGRSTSANSPSASATKSSRKRAPLFPPRQESPCRRFARRFAAPLVELIVKPFCAIWRSPCTVRKTTGQWPMQYENLLHPARRRDASFIPQEGSQHRPLFPRPTFSRRPFNGAEARPGPEVSSRQRRINVAYIGVAKQGTAHLNTQKEQRAGKQYRAGGGCAISEETAHAAREFIGGPSPRRITITESCSSEKHVLEITGAITKQKRRVIRRHTDRPYNRPGTCAPSDAVTETISGFRPVVAAPFRRPCSRSPAAALRRGARLEIQLRRMIRRRDASTPYVLPWANTSIVLRPSGAGHGRARGHPPTAMVQIVAPGPPIAFVGREPESSSCRATARRPALPTARS